MVKVLWSNFRWLTFSLYKKACVYVIASLSCYLKEEIIPIGKCSFKRKKTNMFERGGVTKFIKILTVRPATNLI